MRARAHVQSEFFRLMRRLTWHDIGVLCSVAEKGTLIWDPVSLTASRCTSVPWPITYLLNSYHKKHIFKQKYSLKGLRTCLSQLRYKKQWQRHFIESGDTGAGSAYRHLRNRHATPPCPHATSADSMFEWFTEEVSHTAATRIRTHGGTKPPLVQFALKLLQSSPYIILQTDKDGGFVLAVKETVVEQSSAFMAPRWYEPVAMHENIIHDFITGYRQCAVDVAGTHNDPTLLHELLRDFRPGFSVIGRIVMNIKTHKPASEQVPRIIHANHLSPFKPFLRHISVQCRKFLSQHCKHLLKDFRDLACELSNYRFPKLVKINTADIKDFYMSGDHAQLLESLRTVLVFCNHEGRRLTSLLDMAAYVLRGQYVRHPDSNTYRVKQGSGMGMIASDALSKVDFWLRVERFFLGTDGKPIRKAASFGLLLWKRFKDDIICFIDPGTGEDTRPTNTRLFWQSVRGSASKAGYTLKVEVRSNSVQYLNLCIYKGPRFRSSRVMDISIFQKPTRAPIKLSSASMHPRNVHMSWPVAVQKGFKTFCTGRADYISASSILIFELMLSDPTHPAIAALIDSHVGGDAATARTREPRVGPWCAIPFHPCVQSVVPRKFVLFHSVFTQAGLQEIAPQLTYKLGGRHLVRLLTGLRPKEATSHATG